MKQNLMMESSEENYRYHVLDPTTPWFEWLSYQECCCSLGVTPSLTRFMWYNEYFKNYGNN